MRAVWCLVAAWMSLGVAAAQTTTLKVGVEGGEETEARRMATFGGEACPAIESYPLEGASRLDAELLILCNALRLGGPPVRLDLVPQPNYNRGLAEAIAGRIDLPPQTVWSSELDEHGDTLLRSAPVIQAGEWQVGLFTTADRGDVLAVRTLAELRRLKAAAPRGWIEDWRALSAIGFAQLLDVQASDSVFHMIQAGRADVTLRAFSPAPDLGSLPGSAPVRILPVRGFKVALPAARHFAVSRRHPDAEAIVRQLDAGLNRLRAQGAIQRVFEAVGLFEPRVADWQVLGYN